MLGPEVILVAAALAARWSLRRWYRPHVYARCRAETAELREVDQFIAEIRAAT